MFVYDGVSNPKVNEDRACNVLRKKGLLTDAEFDSEKKKLLEGD